MDIITKRHQTFGMQTLSKELLKSINQDTKCAIPLEALFLNLAVLILSSFGFSLRS